MQTDSDSSTLTARRERVAASLELTDEILLVGAGEPLPLPEGTDQTYPFRAHSEYFYLTGLDNPGGVVAFDPRRGPVKGWTSFVPDVTESERIWEARAQDPGETLSRLEPWLTTRRGRTVINLGAPLRGVRADDARTAAIREKFAHARRPKDPSEIALLRRAATATAAGFEALRAHLQSGVTERALQIELEAAFFRLGADRTGYGTIVGTGANSAVLHFSPSGRAAKRGEFVLVDAGAEIDRYVIDVTRTYVVGGKPTGFQRELFQLVLAAEEAAVARCVSGAEWKDIHLQAALEMTAGLVDMKIMRGNPAALVEQGAHTLFFPHGLGHLVGLGVRDASGRLPGREPFTGPGVEEPAHEPAAGSRLRGDGRAGHLLHSVVAPRSGAPQEIPRRRELAVGGKRHPRWRRPPRGQHPRDDRYSRKPDAKNSEGMVASRFDFR